MFGWKGYGFGEKATEDNLNGKGEIWNLIKSWRPFIKYERTDVIKEKATGEILLKLQNQLVDNTIETS